MQPVFQKMIFGLAALSMLICMELMIIKPEFFWRLLGILIAAVILASLYASGFIFQRRLKQLTYLVLPIFYTVGCLSLFVLAQKSVTQHLFLIGVSFFFGLTLHNTATLNRCRFNANKEVMMQSAAQQRHRVVLAINQAIVILTCFFIFSSLFGIIYLLSFPIWQALIIAVFVLFLIAFQFLDELFPVRRSLVYAAITSLTLIQIFWSLTFWPTNYIANAIVIIASLYIILSILEKYAQGLLAKRLIRVYIIMVLIAVGAVLSTAQWTPR